MMVQRNNTKSDPNQSQIRLKFKCDAHAVCDCDK